MIFSQYMIFVVFASVSLESFSNRVAEYERNFS